MKKKQLKKVFPLLELLHRMPDADRAIVLQFLNSTGCDGIYECIHNGLWNKTLDVSQREILKKKLGENSNTFRYVNKAKANPIRRQKKLVQVGSGVGVIIGLLLPYLAQYLFAK